MKQWHAMEKRMEQGDGRAGGMAARGNSPTRPALPSRPTATWMKNGSSWEVALASRVDQARRHRWWLVVGAHTNKATFALEFGALMRQHARQAEAQVCGAGCGDSPVARGAAPSSRPVTTTPSELSHLDFMLLQRIAHLARCDLEQAGRLGLHPPTALHGPDQALALAFGLVVRFGGFAAVC